MEDRNEQGLGATQQTVAKLEPDALHEMWRASILSDSQWEAAILIRNAYKYIIMAVDLRQWDYETMGTAPGYRCEDQASEPKFIGAYNRWFARMAERRWAVRPILDVAVDHKTCHDVEHLKRALSLYWARG